MVDRKRLKRKATINPGKEGRNNKGASRSHVGRLAYTAVHKNLQYTNVGKSGAGNDEFTPAALVGRRRI